MHTLSEDEFIKLAKKGNIIPVYKEICADTETPVSSYLKFGLNNYSYLLESVEGEEKIARFSFLGMNAAIIFKSKKNKVSITRYNYGSCRKKSLELKKTFLTKASPLDELRKVIKGIQFVEVKGLPRFSGGFVGYIGYDMVRFFEPKLFTAKLKDDLKTPDMCFVFAENLIIFDHLRQRMKIIVNTRIDSKIKSNNSQLKARYKQAINKISQLEARLASDIPVNKGRFQMRRINRVENIPVKSNMTKASFKKAVLKAKEYIKKGDIIQVVLSQRFSARVTNTAFDIYRNLRSINPSPYMYYLNFEDVSLVGSSPEMFVRCEEGKVQMRPIAGTRRRGKDDKEDSKLARNLLSDEKERAEHLMLVDLGRNDLGRVCRYATVKVDEFMNIEKYSHVMHIVSNVKGRLGAKKNIFDVVSSTFPAGTVTGAPKVRAMEIIDELENVSRGPYAGCVGYFSFSGNLDTCITIRTIVIKANKVYIQAGAGIVADSDPDKEYLETVNKAKAQIEALTV